MPIHDLTTLESQTMFLVDSSGNYHVIQPGAPNPVTPQTLSQANWFIDPVNGNDANDGSTAGTALKTNAQFSAMLGKGNVISPGNGSVSTPPTVTVTYLNDVPASDSLSLDVILGPSPFGSTQLVFKGTTPTATPITGPFTVTAKNRATNTPWELLTGAAAAGLVTGGTGGGAIRMFDATQNAYFWGWKVAVSGPDSVNFSEPLTFPGFGNRVSNANRITPANGDNFELQTLRVALFGELRIGGIRQQGTRPRVIFQDICEGTTVPTEGTSIVSDGATEFYWYGCSLTRSSDTFATAREMFFENCAITLNVGGGPVFALGGLVFFDGGAHTYQTFPGAGAFYRWDMDVILEKCIMQSTAYDIWEFGTCGVFDSASIPGGIPSAISVAAPTIEVIKLQDTVGFLWGGGAAGQNTGPGVLVTYGKQFRYATFSGVTPADITITGTGGDFALTTGVTNGYAPTPLSVAPNAGGVTAGGATFVGPFTNSWANLGTAQPGGFGGVAVNPASNSWIVPV